MSDELSRSARLVFQDAGHIVSYLSRHCPFDGMSCGACPTIGCDRGAIRQQIKNLVNRNVPYEVGQTIRVVLPKHEFNKDYEIINVNLETGEVQLKEKA